MIVIHSLWTYPLLKNRWGIKGQLAKSVNLYKLSFLYLKKLGFEVVLHTDLIGKEFLKTIPYDRVETSLEYIPKEYVKYWAVGKIISLQKEGVGAMHVDGDVFFKSSEIKKVLNEPYDVLVQMAEGEATFNKDYLPQLVYINSLTDMLKSPIKNSFNTGILQFKNEVLFNKYYNLVFKLIDLYQKRGVYSNFYTKEVNFYEVMLILEQYSLPIICDELGSDVKFFLNKFSNTNYDVTKEAIEKGFVHALGNYKYSDEFQEKVKKRIKEINL